MLPISSAQILALLIKYKYLVIFPIAVLEGPIVTVIAGFLISLKVLDPLVAYALIILADLIGDSMYYSIGRLSHTRFFRWFRNFVGLNEKRLLMLEGHFRKHDWKILIFGKTQAIGSLGLIAAGIVKIPYKRFIWYNAIGTIPKSLIFLGIGFFFGYASTEKYLSMAGWISSVTAALLIVCYILLKRYLRKKDSAFR